MGNYSPRGQRIPQTVDSLQGVMAADAVLMERMGLEIASLKRTVAQQALTLKRVLRHRAQLRTQLREQSCD